MFQTRWPMQIGGGLFLVCVGIGVIGAGLLGGVSGLRVFFGSAVVGFAAILISRKAARTRAGAPTRTQILAVCIAVIFEAIVFVSLSNSGLFGIWTEHMRWAVVLAVVNVHFIIMRWSHGPLMMALAISGLIWLGIASGLNVSLPLLICGDGVLKIAFGLIMAAPLLRAAPADTSLES